jgi:hypothetical protein
MPDDNKSTRVIHIDHVAPEDFGPATKMVLKLSGRMLVIPINRGGEDDTDAQDCQEDED